MEKRGYGPTNALLLNCFANELPDGPKPWPKGISPRRGTLPPASMFSNVTPHPDVSPHPAPHHPHALGTTPTHLGFACQIYFSLAKEIYTFRPRATNLRFTCCFSPTGHSSGFVICEGRARHAFASWAIASH